MAILEDKIKAFGNIAALRTLVEGFPKLMLNSSFPSINNNSNSQDFLVDLLKATVGYEKLREIVIDILVYDLGKIEQEIKSALKRELKTMVSCGINPTLPVFIKSTGTGVIIEVSKVDFFNILKVNPNSEEGKLLYDDVSLPLISSTDFNTFLYGTIQDDGTTKTWTQNPPILDVKFDSVGTQIGTQTRPNNSLTLKAHSSYNTKKLTDFNNDYIDSLSLFGSAQMIANIIDLLFGSVSIKLNKTTKQLERETEIESIINCIVNSDETDVIDDSYFSFSNTEIQRQQYDASMRKQGIRLIEGCGCVTQQIDSSHLIDLNKQLSGTTSPEEKKNVITNSIDSMASQAASGAENSSDVKTIQLGFIEGLLKKLITSIVNLILSPKVMIIFILNYKIIYGQSEDFGDAKDFLKKNKTLIQNISKTVRDTLIKALLKETLKQISFLVGQSSIKIQTEKVKAVKGQLLSLLGVPQEVIRIINGLA